METFIATIIKRHADISEEKGMEKYSAYFLNVSLYESYREEVDEILRNDGYASCIVK